MTGPEHYREAERLVQHSKNHTDQGNGADDKIAELAATQAQVHATLALAEATYRSVTLAGTRRDAGPWLDIVSPGWREAARP